MITQEDMNKLEDSFSQFTNQLDSFRKQLRKKTPEQRALLIAMDCNLRTTVDLLSHVRSSVSEGAGV